MATAEAYDRWDDPGLAFDETQVAEYEPKACAAVRVNELVRMIPLATRRSQLGEKPTWWDNASRRMWDCLSWYCVVAELPLPDRDDVFTLPEGKALTPVTVQARNLGTEQEWLDGWGGEVSAEMAQHVTLGRRCVGAKKMSGWGKREKSLSNKIANSLVKEMNVIAKLQDGLNARPSAKEEAEA